MTDAGRERARDGRWWFWLAVYFSIPFLIGGFMFWILEAR